MTITNTMQQLYRICRIFKFKLLQRTVKCCVHNTSRYWQLDFLAVYVLYHETYSQNTYMIYLYRLSQGNPMKKAYTRWREIFLCVRIEYSALATLLNMRVHRSLSATVFIFGG